MMKPEEIIEGLKYTVAMCEYDPLTGDIIERCFMNEMTRTTYDACKAAIEFIEKHQYVHNKCKKCIEFSEFKKQPNSLEQIIWERDTAINQLKELGYGFGERIEKCDDYISREETLNKINGLIAEYIPLMPTGWTLPLNIAKTINELPSVTPQQTSWIPVSERLPEDGSWSLFTDGKRVSIERYKADAFDHFFPKGKYFVFEDVIAWMPLPKPYKEGEK